MSINSREDANKYYQVSPTPIRDSERIQPIPVYSCPNDFILNPDNTCSKAVSYGNVNDNQGDTSLTASVLSGFVNFLGVLIGR